MSNYYVFRINYDDRFKLIRRELVNHHLLRQGWGTYGMALDSSYDTFKAGWQSEWEKDLPDEMMRARYNNLSIMLKIEPGIISSYRRSACRRIMCAEASSSQNVRRNIILMFLRKQRISVIS